MFTWDDVISRYKVLEKGAKGLERSTLAGCMAQMLPSLRKAIGESYPNVHLSLVMLALELRLPATSQAVVIQCVDKCHFELRLKNSRYEVLQEQKVDLPEVVEQILVYLEMSRQ